MRHRVLVDIIMIRDWAGESLQLPRRIVTSRPYDKTFQKCPMDNYYFVIGTPKNNHPLYTIFGMIAVVSDDRIGSRCFDDCCCWFCYIFGDFFFSFSAEHSRIPFSCPEISSAKTVRSDCSGKHWNGATATSFGRVPTSTSKTVIIVRLFYFVSLRNV